LQPSQPAVLVGATLQLTAVLQDAGGNTLSGRAVAWTSDDPGVASISDVGRITGVAPGTVGVSATSEGKVGSATVTVNAPPVQVATVEVTALDATMLAGSSVQLAATPRDAGGGVITGRSVTWSSSNARATVDVGGLVTAVTAGPASITATAGGVHGVTTTTVVVRFTAITAAMEHTCALTPDGEAYCWGLNNVGQLGNGTQTNTDAPAKVLGGLRFTKLVAMGMPPVTHTCGLTTSHALYCWGRNYNGELGSPGSDFSTTPVPVTGGLQFKDVAGNQVLTCGVTTGHQAYCWGAGSSGELGDGGASNQYLVPHAVVGGLQFESITVAWGHVCALTTAGEALCWGYNGHGQLGTGDDLPRSVPTAVQGGLLFTQISAGGAYTCGITTGSRAYCWGFNTGGQLGVGDQLDRATPAAVSGALALAGITAGQSETCAVGSDATGYCWGWLIGTPSPTPTLVPVPIGGGLSWTSLSGAENGACGIAAGPLAYCWGVDDTGQQGNGSDPSSLSPARVLYQP
jgi:alpha-tubulin suppressor-like RCC1 family protein